MPGGPAPIDPEQHWAVVYDPDLGAQRPALDWGPLAAGALLGATDPRAPGWAARHRALLWAWLEPGAPGSSLTACFRAAVRAEGARLAADRPAVAALLAALEATGIDP